jgi:hypothetical protein
MMITFEARVVIPVGKEGETTYNIRALIHLKRSRKHRIPLAKNEGCQI